MNKNWKQEYPWELPIFNEKRTITKRVRKGLEIILEEYINIAKEIAKRTEDNPKNYEIKEVYVVGSGARENKKNSDLDIMLITPKISNELATAISVYLARKFAYEGTKQEQIDTYVRKEDRYPERASKNITKYVKKTLTKYNKKLK